MQELVGTYLAQNDVRAKAQREDECEPEETDPTSYRRTARHEQQCEQRRQRRHPPGPQRRGAGVGVDHNEHRNDGRAAEWCGGQSRHNHFRYIGGGPSDGGFGSSCVIAGHAPCLPQRRIARVDELGTAREIRLMLPWG